MTETAARTGTAADPDSTVNVGVWAAFAGCLIGLFMQMLDTTVVNIALPSLTVDLGASTAEQLLVLTVYTLAFACTLLTAATMGARFGRRRMFITALILFTGFSVLCGIAQDPLSLIIFRAGQGISAALMSAQTLALIAAMFPKVRHGLVFGIYGAVAGLAAILGPVVGGLLVSADVLGLGWRLVFLVNVPLGILAVLVARTHLPGGSEGSTVSPDIIGMMLSSAGLFLLLYPLAVGREQGWPPHLAVMVGGAVVALSLFVWHQRRLSTRGGDPLLQPSLFRSSRFNIGMLLSLLFFSVFAGFFFTISVAAQFGLGYSALRTGLLALPFAIGAAIGSLASPVAVNRLGAGRVLCLGAMVLAGGFTWLGLALHPDDAVLSIPAIIAPLAVGGLGVGLFVAPLQTAILSDTTTENIGSASGCVPTMQQIGASLGLAVVTIFFFAQVSNQTSTAVPTTRTELVAALDDSSVDPMFRTAVADRFAQCAETQLGSAHPERPAPGCTPTGATSSGMVARIAESASDDLLVAARSVAARTFLGAFQLTLWVLAGLAAVIGLLALALRSHR